MCIIIAKRKGRVYSEEELTSAIKIAEEHNVHGAGFALKREGEEKVYLSKGYLYYYDIMVERLRDLDIQENDELVVHLRYATSGDVSVANCHPFVVSSDLAMVEEDEIEVDLPVLAHNGTFWDFSYTNTKTSDTVNFITEFASQEGALDALRTIQQTNEDMAKAMMGSNRICVLFPDARPMMTVGSWNRLKKEDYCFVYSNFYHQYPDVARAYGGKSPHVQHGYAN